MISQKVRYREVVDCGSVSQLDVFKRARLWLAQTSDSETTPTLSDKETGDLVSHETMTVALPRSESFAGGVYTLRYCLIIEYANRKYRVTLS